MLHNLLIDIVIMMLNVIAPHSKILYTILITLNKITSSSIYFAETLFWNLRFLKTQKLCTTIYNKNEKGRQI